MEPLILPSASGNAVLQPPWLWLSLWMAAAAVVAMSLQIGRGPLARWALAHVTDRSSHTTPTPQIGGLVIVPVMLGLIGLAGVLDSLPLGLNWAWLSAGVLGLWVLGAIDDRTPLPAVVKFAVHGLAAAAALSALPADFPALLPDWVGRSAEWLILWLGLMWMINLTNFMDGLDLMTVTGVGLPMAGLALLATLGMAPAAAGALGGLVAGGLAGFATSNWPQARAFLGDGGSLPLGLGFGVALLLMAGAIGPWLAALPALYYLADTGITLLRRAWQKKAIWRAHREHFFQKARGRGEPVLAIIGRLAVLQLGLLGFTVFGMSFANGGAWLAVAMAIAATGLFLAWCAGQAPFGAPKVEPVPDRRDAAP